MINKCTMCDNKKGDKITVNIKTENGYKTIDEIYLCDDCLDKCKKKNPIILDLLKKRKKISE